VSASADVDLKNGAWAAIRFTAHTLWTLVRFPVLAFLVVLEPVVQFALGALSLLFILMALFLEAVSTRPTPVLGMLATGIGCVALLALYHALIRILSR
jgi:hypothetical protein